MVMMTTLLFQNTQRNESHHFWMLRNTLLHLKSFHLSHKSLKSVLRFGKNYPICISITREIPGKSRKSSSLHPAFVFYQKAESLNITKQLILHWLIIVRGRDLPAHNLKLSSHGVKNIWGLTGCFSTKAILLMY